VRTDEPEDGLNSADVDKRTTPNRLQRGNTQKSKFAKSDPLRSDFPPRTLLPEAIGVSDSKYFVTTD